MPCKWWWGGTLRLEKSILPFSIMKNISIFFSFNISEFSHIIWNYISIYVKKKKRWKKWTRVFCVFDLLLFFFCFFFANERYKHINLLNIFISATLFCFWVHATVSFFSSFRRCRWELRSSMCRGWEESGVRSGKNEQAEEDVFTMAGHTKHKDVKDVTRHRIEFLIVWFCGAAKTPLTSGPMDPCVPILSMSTRSPLSLAASSGGTGPSNPFVKSLDGDFDEFPSRWHLHFFWA